MKKHSLTVPPYKHDLAKFDTVVSGALNRVWLVYTPEIKKFFEDRLGDFTYFC